jgi:uncharacterized membrane protein
MKSILKNWKTTLAGIITLGVTVAGVTHTLSPDQVSAVVAVAVAFGLISAKDGNVTGGTVKQ